MANNASAHLAAPLAADGTTIVLVAGESGNFPPLAAGEFFPMTLSDAEGHIEIVRVTNCSSNLLTAVRAQEGTSALAWDTGDRAEIRMTAGVVTQLQADALAAVEALADQTETDIETAIGALRDETASNLAVALTALIPTGFGPIPWSRTSSPIGWTFADGRTLFSNSGLDALRALYIAEGFPFGQDGSGNPKLPDMRGRTAAGVDNMGGTAASRLTGATLGAALGAETHALTTAQLPAHSHAVTDPGHNHTVNDPTHAHSVYDPGHAHGVSDPGHNHTVSDTNVTGNGGSGMIAGNGVAEITDSRTTNTKTTGISIAAAVTSIGIYGAGTGISLSATTTGISTQNTGSGQAHNNVQPTLVCNFILKT
jgi:microcystin-dependent protein